MNISIITINSVLKTALLYKSKWYDRLSLPSNWGQKSASFLMVKCDVFSKFHVKIPNFIYIHSLFKNQFSKAIKKIRLLKEREHWIFKIPFNLKKISALFFIQRCEFFPISPKCRQFSQFIGNLNPVPKRGCDSPGIQEKNFLSVKNIEICGLLWFTERGYWLQENNLFEVLGPGQHVDEVWNKPIWFPRNQAIQKWSRNLSHDKFGQVLTLSQIHH